MKKTTIRRLRAVLCIVAGFVLTMCVAEVLFLLALYKPFLKEMSLWVIYLHIAWLWGGMYIFYRITKRRTSWWRDLDPVPSDGQDGKGGGTCR